MVRVLAASLALNRVAFGIAYLVAPSKTAGGWVGSVARDPASHVLTRALGARDLVLGLGALGAMWRGEPTARPWFAAHAIADATDLAATIASRRRLPRDGYRFGVAMAGASTAVAVLGAARLSD
jgi:hypothetical protein